MNETPLTPKSRCAQTGTIAMLSLAYVAGAITFQVVLKTDILFTHFAYIPVVLAGMWWGRKAVFLALFLAAITLAFQVIGMGFLEAWRDAIRVTFLVIVGFAVGAASDRAQRAHEALLSYEANYRHMVEKSLTGILVYRGDQILLVNSRLAFTLGREADWIVGRSFWEFIDPRDRQKVRDLVAKRQTEGVSDLHYECRVLKEDGSSIWVEILSSSTPFEGRPAVLVNLYDITAKMESDRKSGELSEIARRQEEQLVHSARLAEMGEMAASVAHELNQPLTGIRNFAMNATYMIEQDAGTLEDVKDNLRLISRQVDRAAKIIGQMRDLTRRSERQMIPLDIGLLLRESVEFLTPQFRLSRVDVELDLQEDMPQVLGDRVRLEQVFLNLLTNARQAMEESETRRLDVRSRFVEGDECPVSVTIADTGKGFDPKEIEKLFSPFYSTKKAGHGTGLGLSISLEIVKEHRGQIEALGRMGEGATFTVKLPVAPGQESPWVSGAPASLLNSQSTLDAYQEI